MESNNLPLQEPVHQDSPTVPEEFLFREDVPLGKKIIRVIKEFALFSLQVIILSMIIINFIGRVSVVQGSSMSPCLETNDRVIINLLVYRFNTPHRGDIVVFQCPVDAGKDYIKRVIALSGEEVEIKNGEVLVNGKTLRENYVTNKFPEENFNKITVPEGHLFVMGDNRRNSEDSRYWGPLDTKLIKGKAILLFWPPEDFNLLK